MSVKKIPALIAVPFIALSLSACGSNSNSSDETTANETTTSQEASSSAEETTPAETSSDSSGSGDSAGKPSRDEVKAGVKKMLEAQGIDQQFSQLGATDEQMDKAYTCITDSLYDEVSNETLETLAKGDPSAPISSADQQTVENNAFSCGQQIGQELSGNNAG
ncbi:MAG: hypothetical protein Q3979_05000 [Actinomycetaceae bacterium]|nr:hypothetical protein [Actinomycetaceae bacterium]